MADAPIPDTFRRRAEIAWRTRPGASEVWDLIDAEVILTATQAAVPLVVWTGFPFDRARIELMSVLFLGSGNQTDLEFIIRSAYDCNPGVQRATGTLSVFANQPLAGMLVQVAGILGTSLEVLGRVTAGPSVKLALRALVDDRGVPISTTKGLLG